MPAQLTQNSLKLRPRSWLRFFAFLDVIFIFFVRKFRSIFRFLGRCSLCCSRFSLSLNLGLRRRFLCFFLLSQLTLKRSTCCETGGLKTLTCNNNNGEKRLLRCRRLLQLLITDDALSRSSNFACCRATRTADPPGAFEMLWQQKWWVTSNRAFMVLDCSSK